MREKTNNLGSVTAQLICGFVYAYANCLFSDVVAQGPGQRKDELLAHTRRMNNKELLSESTSTLNNKPKNKLTDHGGDSNDATCAVVRVVYIPLHAKPCCRPTILLTAVNMILVILLSSES